MSDEQGPDWEGLGWRVAAPNPDPGYLYERVAGPGWPEDQWVALGTTDDAGQKRVSGSDAHWTIGDALLFLDPAPPRRTLARWLKAMPRTGERAQRHGGPPAPTHSAADIMRKHAAWAKRTHKDLG